MDTDSRIRRFLDGIYSEKEIPMVLKALEDPDTFDRMATEAATEADRQALSETDDTAAYAREATSILRRINNPSYRVSSHTSYSKAFRFGAAAAAVIMIALATTWLLSGHKGNPQTTEPVYASISTTYGETREMTLADGSVVVLNSCSTLRYPETFTDDKRNVYLSGEAFFIVSHDDNHPFVVNCQSLAVTVLGTEFDVKSYESDMSANVAVQSGLVKVDLEDAMLHLHADQQLSFNNLTHDFDRSSEPLPVGAWRNGELTFNRTHIADVATELERTFHCHITFRNGVVPDNRITGSHSCTDLDEILYSLEYISGIHNIRQGDSIILYR